MSSKSKMYALLIGVGDDLPYTIKDATKLYDTLIDPELAGYEKDNVILVCDKEATRDGILNSLDKLIETTNEDSSVLIYYSGHGGKYMSQHKFFLQPYGMTAENYATHWVMAEELTEKINAIKSNKIVFLLDCCHAEGMTQEGLLNMEGLAQKLNDKGGMWVISSCQDNQKSWRLPNAENSLFTECLLEVISGNHKKPFTEPNVTITDVVEHIFDEVPKRASKCIDENTGEPINQRPFAKFQMSENVVLSNFPRNMESHAATITELEPNIEKLDERGLIKLLDAMSFLGRRDEAINILENHKKTSGDADLLNILGNLFKEKYLETNFEEPGLVSLEHHKKALEIATKEEDEQQIYLNSINIAFLYLLLDLSKKEVRFYADLAFNAAKNYYYPSPEKFGTMGEACIYLNQIEKAKENYNLASEKAGIRTRMNLYKDAYAVYTTLYDDNKDDPFLIFLNNKLLS